MGETDDARHKREEGERRAKRKASKKSRGSEKDRKRREHTQRVLDQQNKRAKTGSSSTPSKSSEKSLNSSAFQALFSGRAQGFRIDFSFRNAPPRPPVGPCFVGQGLDGHLMELGEYRNHNAVESSYSWKLHANSDLGVPLAPSAMNLAMYERPSQTIATVTTENLHADDAALLDWKGSWGDTAADELNQRRDRARASARLALAGKPVPAMNAGAPQFQKKKGASRKDFSRVLDHGMVFFMKKTTYLSNDYSRKVHDFTSLATTKARTATELQAKQKQLDRGSKSIENTFTEVANISSKKKPLVHPSGNKKLTPVWDIPLLPNVEHWGHAYTHVVVDNPPKKGATNEVLETAYIAHVEQASATDRMQCQMLVPTEQPPDHKSIAHYDLDVVPLKESEESANSSFCIFISPTEASYLPIPSRVQLSTGRPSKKQAITTISTRPFNPAQDDEDYLERMAQVDADVGAEDGAGGGGAYDARAAGNKIDDAGFGQFDEDDDSDED